MRRQPAALVVSSPSRVVERAPSDCATLCMGRSDSVLPPSEEHTRSGDAVSRPDKLPPRGGAALLAGGRSAPRVVERADPDGVQHCIRRWEDAHTPGATRTTTGAMRTTPRAMLTTPGARRATPRVVRATHAWCAPSERKTAPLPQSHRCVARTSVAPAGSRAAVAPTACSFRAGHGVRRPAAVLRTPKKVDRRVRKTDPSGD